MNRSTRRHFSRHDRAVPATAILFTMLLLVGCGTFHSTLAQDRVWAAETVCRREVPTFHVTMVAPDGRWTGITNDASETARAEQCMNREVKNWRGAQPPSAVAMPTRTAPMTATALDVSTPKEVNVPVWKVGDEWAYRYDGAMGSGTYVWSVARTDVMDGFDCYVVKSGERQIFYRKEDLASVREIVSGAVVRRDVPPRLNYQWPLVVGNKWQHDLTFENWRDRQTIATRQSWQIVAIEDVTVPAGTFRTIKITSRNERTNSPLYEMWYAPDVKQWVKIHEWRESGEQTREMIAYKLR